MEARWRHLTHGWVYGILQCVLNFVVTIAGAEVIGEARRELAFDPADRRVVDDVTKEARRETAREEEERAPDRTIRRTEVLDRAIARITVEE